IHRAAAHPGDDAGVRQRPAFELGENQIPMRADHVLEHADDVGLELLDVRAIEDRASDPDHAGPNLVDSHLGGGAGWPGRDDGQDREQGKKKATDWHGFEIQFTGEVVAGQGEMGIRVDTPCRRLLSSALLMPQSFAPRLFCPAARTASAWWWYWASTEEASALA